MTTDKLDTKELFASLDESATQFQQLISSLSDGEINSVPFKNSWTAAQLTDHVIKSNTGIAKALNIEGKPTQRYPAERERELREMFLDFTVKFKSPDFILPTKDTIDKEIVAAGL